LRCACSTGVPQVAYGAGRRVRRWRHGHADAVAALAPSTQRGRRPTSTATAMRSGAMTTVDCRLETATRSPARPRRRAHARWHRLIGVVTATPRLMAHRQSQGGRGSAQLTRDDLAVLEQPSGGVAAEQLTGAAAAPARLRLGQGTSPNKKPVEVGCSCGAPAVQPAPRSEGALSLSYAGLAPTADDPGCATGGDTAAQLRQWLRSARSQHLLISTTSRVRP
jgi:hypothetical protein